MPKLEPLTIIVRGGHDTGKTTVASFIKMSLEEMGFDEILVTDLPPLTTKTDFGIRLARNRERPIHIIVELKP